MTLFGGPASYNLVYATEDDLATYMLTNDAPANAELLLRSASRLVRRATMGAYYAADASGLPTDTAIMQAFNDATCAQAAAWSVLNINPLAGGAVTPGAATSKTLDGASITYADAKRAADDRAAAVAALVPDAADILGAFGLLQTRVWTYG